MSRRLTDREVGVLARSIVNASVVEDSATISYEASDDDLYAITLAVLDEVGKVVRALGARRGVTA